MSDSSPMEGVVQGVENQSHDITTQEQDQAGPPSLEPFDELFGGAYMQRMPSNDLTPLCKKAAESGLDKNTDDAAAAAVYLTLLRFLPSRAPEFWALFEELYPKARESILGLELLARLDDGLEITCATSWTVKSGNKDERVFTVTECCNVIPEGGTEMLSHTRLDVTHESVEHDFTVRFHGMDWTFANRVPISYLVKDHITGRLVEINAAKLAQRRRVEHIDSLIEELRSDTPENARRLEGVLILYAHKVLEADQSSETLMLSRFRKNVTGEARDIIDRMGPAALRFRALVALELAARLMQDDGPPISTAGSDHSGPAGLVAGVEESSGPAQGGNHGSQVASGSHKAATHSTNPQAGQPGQAACDPELQASLAKAYLCIKKKDFLVDKSLMGLARFGMKKAGDEACRTVFLDEKVLSENIGKNGLAVSMADDDAERYEEASVRGMFVWDRHHFSIIVRDQGGKVTYLDTLEEGRSRREASAHAFYSQYLRAAGIDEEFIWVPGSIPAQNEGWECGLFVVELWLRFVDDNNFDPTGIKEWDLDELARRFCSDIRCELGERVMEAVEWLDRKRFVHANVLEKVCEAAAHEEGAEKGVAKLMAQVGKKMGYHDDPRERRRCCTMLVAIAALRPDHSICGEWVEQEVPPGHWVAGEIDRITSGKVYNFDNIESSKVGHPTA